MNTFILFFFELKCFVHEVKLKHILTIMSKISKKVKISSAISVRDTRFISGQFYKNSVPMAPKEILSLKADFDLSNKNMMSII